MHLERHFVFQGASSLSIDSKGRLSVPARHQEVLRAMAQGEVTVTRHPHGCLVVFPRPAWEKFRDRIAQTPMDGQWIKRLFLGNAMDVALDATGRILISPELRKATGIDREVVLMGMGDYLELWDAAKYHAEEEKALQSEIANSFKTFAF